MLKIKITKLLLVQVKYKKTLKSKQIKIVEVKITSQYKKWLKLKKSLVKFKLVQSKSRCLYGVRFKIKMLQQGVEINFMASLNICPT